MVHHFRWFRAVLAAVVLTLAVPGAVSAHAVLVDSAPADGQVFAQAPGRLVLRFNEPVVATALRLVGDHGDIVSLKPSDGGMADRVTAVLPPLRPGGYIVSWRLVSVDGHPVGGSLLFTVGAAGPDDRAMAQARAGAEVSLALRGAVAATRALSCAGSLGAAGLVLFLILFGHHAAVDGRSIRRGALAAVAAGAVATLCGLALQGVVLGGDGWASAVSGRIVALAGGVAALARLAGLSAVALGMMVRRPSGAAVGAVGVALVAASFALAGHTVPHASFPSILSSGLPVGPASGLLVFHLLAVAFWVGAFWPLIRATRHPDRAAVLSLMVGFSAVASWLVPLLAVAGLALAWTLAGSWPALVTTPYGLVLCGKVAVVSALLGLAALNKGRFVPALASGDGAAARLRRAIILEAALAAVVFGLTAALSSLPPPGHEPAAAGEPARRGETVSASVAAFRLDLTVTPARPGRNTVELRIAAPDGTPREVMRALLRLDRPDLGIESISRAMEPAGGGVYRYTGMDMAMPGRWRVVVDLLVSDFEKRTVELFVTIDAGLSHAPSAAPSPHHHAP